MAVLKLREIEDFFQRLTTIILGLDPNAPENQDKVRIAWPTKGSPAWGINDDVTFLRVNTANDQYTMQRDTEYKQNSPDDAIKTVSYTRVHLVKWIIYGPNSYENAWTIRDGLFNFKELLSQNNLFLILNFPTPARLPEIFNGQWWQRADFEATFNEKVSKQTTVPYIKSARIQLITEKGVVENADSTT